MNQFLSGASAVFTGAECAGIQRIFLHSTIATAYLVKAYHGMNCSDRYFACSASGSSIIRSSLEAAYSGFRVMCIISSGMVSMLSEYMPKNREIAAGMVILVEGTGYSSKMNHFAAAVKMPMWLGESVSEIHRMICDAADYSEITKKPGLVWVPERYLYARCTVQIRNTRRLTGLNKEKNGRKSYILSKIFSEYNTVQGKGKYAVIAAGDCGDYVSEIITPKADIRLMKINMPHPWPADAVRVFVRGAEKCLVIEREDDYCCRMVRQSLGREIKITGISVPGNTLSDFDTVYSSLEEFMGADSGVLKYVGRPEERTPHKFPQIPERDHRMCPGCLLRRNILEQEMQEGFLQGYDRIYCEKIRAFVVTGVKPDRLNVSYYKEDIIVKASMCVREKGEVPVIDAGTCSWCAACMEETGCPALWRSGLKVRLDAGMCTGCGLCMRYCPNGSIRRR